MKNYIFITKEGSTHQPDSAWLESDVDNCQVIGFAKGHSANEAMQNLIKENEFLLESDFNELICMEMKNLDHYRGIKYFYLKEYK